VESSGQVFAKPPKLLIGIGLGRLWKRETTRLLFFGLMREPIEPIRKKKDLIRVRSFQRTESLLRNTEKRKNKKQE